MKYYLLILTLFFWSQTSFSQIVNNYSVSFKNAEHHEAHIEATFTNLRRGTISLTMSRNVKGDYENHAFAKNIHDVEITDSRGRNIKSISRPNLSQWDVTGHDGTIHVEYNLFADQADGIFSQIDETHALLSNPSAFMFIEAVDNRPIEITFELGERNWRVATHMSEVSANTYLATDLQHFMDSPILLSNYILRERKIGSQDKPQTIKMALHYYGTDQEADDFFDTVINALTEESKIFGGFPSFENNEYLFLACFMPQVSEGGVAHRNTAVITSPTSLAYGGVQKKVEVFSRQFLHTWNKERITPLGLKPFNYLHQNLTEELWFADGFSEYFTQLALCRSGIITPEELIESFTDTYNRIWGASAKPSLNAIEYSRKVNFTNQKSKNTESIFLPHRDYGFLLALALDMTLRDKSAELSLDDFMMLYWTKYGKTEINYSNDNLFITLREYAGKGLTDKFFSDYVYGNEIPKYNKLLEQTGVYLRPLETPYIGVAVEFTQNGKAQVAEYTLKDSPAYNAGLEKGDIIISIGGRTFSNREQYEEALSLLSSEKSTEIEYRRNGRTRTEEIKIETSPQAEFALFPDPKDKALNVRHNWLNSNPPSNAVE
ncbi:PDZ domain-containing protein [Fulvivirga maritima]|uniref:M61 family metallopeptidase n=1 Tax=Fulvivirga maritima TaxID=2904247 RepID=UPI001F2367C4|nr:PDZ domain-containing protein [Fulvivirga maritima]UII28999.1 PDZ domain-containing protein [Fulvivirga maritima]